MEHGNPLGNSYAEKFLPEDLFARLNEAQNDPCLELQPQDVL